MAHIGIGPYGRIDLGMDRHLVCRDPISAAIAFQAATGSAALFTSAAAVSAFTTGFTILTTVALSAASIALQSSQSRSALSGGQNVSTVDQGTRQPVIAPIPDQRLVLGTVTSSGVLAWRRSKPPYIWYVYLLASHECGEFESLILNGIPVPLNEDGIPIAAPFNDGSTVYLRASYRNGHRDQAIDPLLAADFPTLPSTFRHRGHATVVLKAHYGDDDDHHKELYGSNNVFNPLIRFQGAKYFDPRVASCRMSDPDTWVHGSNWALNVARALYHPWPDMRLVDLGRFDWDKMAVAADICDRWVGKANGMKERNYTADGIVLSSREPTQMLRELLTAGDGIFVAEGGRYHLVAGHKRVPDFTLDQDMLAGGFEWHAETPDADLINTVKTEFVSPERDYKPQVGPVIRRGDLIRQDGRPLETTLSLPFTEGVARATRLGIRKLKETRGHGSGRSSRRAFSGVFSALMTRDLSAGQVVRIDFRDVPQVFGQYRVMKIAKSSDRRTAQIDLVSYDPTIFRHHGPTDERPFEIDEDVLAAEAA